MSNSTPKNSYESLPVTSKLIFLAGIFDGEGSFGIWSKGIGRKKEFACTIEMTDQDTLQKFADMFGGQIFPCKIRKAHHIPTWRWRQNGYRAFLIMDKMIDFMSKRRQEDSSYLLVNHETNPNIFFKCDINVSINLNNFFV